MAIDIDNETMMALICIFGVGLVVVLGFVYIAERVWNRICRLFGIEQTTEEDEPVDGKVDDE